MPPGCGNIPGGGGRCHIRRRDAERPRRGGESDAIWDRTVRKVLRVEWQATGNARVGIAIGRAEWQGLTEHAPCSIQFSTEHAACSVKN